jgi:hypothetical protein
MDCFYNELNLITSYILYSFEFINMRFNAVSDKLRKNVINISYQIYVTFSVHLVKFDFILPEE